MDERNYVSSLNEKELKSLNIAINHLGTSFELCKSIGFIKWKLQQTNKELPVSPTTSSSPIILYGKSNS